MSLHRSTPIPAIRPEAVGSLVSRWGEGPVFHRGHLYYVDIEGRAIRIFDPATGGENEWALDQRVGFVAPTRTGDFIWGGDHGLFRLDPATGQSTALGNPEPDFPNNRFNDGKCSPDGRLFAGTIALDKVAGNASLYRLEYIGMGSREADKKSDPYGMSALANQILEKYGYIDLSKYFDIETGLQKLKVAEGYSLLRFQDGLTTSNGIGWSPDGRTCYHIDTPTRVVTASDYDPVSGALTNRRPAFSTAEIDASPDGLAIDEEGAIWIAFCHGGCVARFRPDGVRLARIDLPCLETTAVAFGGPHLRDLFVTTGLHAKIEEPLAGRLFVIRDMPVPGLPANLFAG